MANEITINASIGCNNGQFRLPTVGGTFTVDQATARGGGPGVLEVPSTGLDVDFGDTTPGWVFLKNLGDDDLLFGPKLDDPLPSPSPEPSPAPDLDMAYLGPLASGQHVIIPLGEDVTLRLASAGDPIDVQVIGLNQ